MTLSPPRPRALAGAALALGLLLPALPAAAAGARPTAAPAAGPAAAPVTRAPVDRAALASARVLARTASDGAQLHQSTAPGLRAPGAALRTAPDGSTSSLVAGSAGAPVSSWSVTYVGFPRAAKHAFQRAVDQWAGIVASPTRIRVCATFKDLGDDGLLGQAGPGAFLVGDTSDGSYAYAVALANSLSGRDLVPLDRGSRDDRCTDDDGYDVQAEFNSNPDADFYTGGGGGPSRGQIDLQTVVLHELGHGLGFLGSMDVEQQRGYYSDPPFIYDRFTVDALGQPLLAEPDGSPSLAVKLRSDVSWNGAEGVEANGGERPPLYAPSTFQPGSSYSHLDEDAYPAGTRNSLLTPQLDAQEVVHDPGPVAVGMLRDLGYRASVEGRTRAAATEDSGVVDLVSRNTDGSLGFRTLSTSDELSPSKDLGGRALGRPAVATRSDGTVEVFERRRDDHLYGRRRAPDGSWTGWQDLGGVITASPAAMRYDDDELRVFVRGDDGALYQRRSPSPGTWSSFKRLGGRLASHSTPAAVSPAPGRIDVVVRSRDDRALRKTLADRDWQSFVTLGGSLLSDPALGSAAVGRSVLLKRGSDKALYAKTLTAEGARNFEALGGTLLGAPGAAAQAGSGQLDVFVVGKGLRLYRKRWSGGSWSGYEALS